MNLTDEFASLVVALGQANIHFAVCGGMALALHGFPRFTRDLDFLIQSDDAPHAILIAQQCGYELEQVSRG